MITTLNERIGGWCDPSARTDQSCPITAAEPGRGLQRGAPSGTGLPQRDRRRTPAQPGRGHGHHRHPDPSRPRVRGPLRRVQHGGPEAHPPRGQLRPRFVVGVKASNLGSPARSRTSRPRWSRGGTTPAEHGPRRPWSPRSPPRRQRSAPDAGLVPEQTRRHRPGPPGHRRRGHRQQPLLGALPLARRARSPRCSRSGSASRPSSTTTSTRSRRPRPGSAPAKATTRFLVVTLGRGVGLGVVIGGQGLPRTASVAPASWGTSSSSRPARTCSCGRRRLPRGADRRRGAARATPARPAARLPEGGTPPPLAELAEGETRTHARSTPGPAAPSGRASRCSSTCSPPP
jgi:hypothetical protein